ncbi:hypothetical protein ACFL9U_13415 [Thermodesulfobacteriota bacterium]
MPGKTGIDAPSALHHIIYRGIERAEIFNDDIDRNNFVDRVADIFSQKILPAAR